jgi:hypothetical protein
MEPLRSYLKCVDHVQVDEFELRGGNSSLFGELALRRGKMRFTRLERTGHGLPVAAVSSDPLEQQIAAFRPVSAEDYHLH